MSGNEFASWLYQNTQFVLRAFCLRVIQIYDNFKSIKEQVAPPEKHCFKIWPRMKKMYIFSIIADILEQNSYH